MEYERWLLLMEKFGFSKNEKTFLDLEKAYSEKHRHYHNRSHIDAALRHLDSCYSIADHPKEVEIALWFHDAIYKTFSSSNEKDSADWAVSFLKDNECEPDINERIHSLIMATLHAYTPEIKDEQLIIDIDLTILGSSDSVYLEFEKNVRQEYRLVPGFIYRKKRVQLLNSFLARDRIYINDFFFNKFETQARSNMLNAISLLS